MFKKIYSLEDLAQFCSSSGLQRFSSEETNSQLVVQVPAVYEQEENESTTLLFGKVKLLHTGLNRNMSNVTYDAAEKCMKTIAYKPVLANFIELEDGTKDFTSHDLEVMEDGKIIYYEHQIGCFTADTPYLEEDPEYRGRFYLYANVAIPRDYTDAVEILERKNGTKVSAEILVNEMSYDANTKELLLTDIEVMGVTCLGIREDGTEVREGMQGARLDIADFSVAKNSICFESSELSKIIQDAVTEALDKHNQQIFEKGGVNEMEDNTIINENEDETIVNEKNLSAENENLEAGEEPTEDPVETYSVNYSVKCGEIVKEFSVSLSDKLRAMNTLVNETYSELDDCYYDVDIFEEDKYVEMHSWWTGKSYRQSFKVKNDTYSLVGDRVEIFVKYLTQDEINKLENMKANYEAISEKLTKYESEPEKMQILESEDYGYVAETEEFAELKKTENHFDLSIDEVKNQADSILMKYAKAQAFNLAPTTEVVPAKPLVSSSKKSGRYGSLFSK